MMAMAATLMLVGCGGGDENAEDINVAAGIPAEVAVQTHSNLASEPAEAVPGVRWRLSPDDPEQTLQLLEADGSVSLALACGGTPPRLLATVPSFNPTRTGELMRLAIGSTEIALTPRVKAAGATGSMGEAVIPPNLGVLFAEAPAVDIVQGVQRIGSTPPPPAEIAGPFVEHCLSLL